MKNIQWGIIGCGDVTEVKSGPAFNKVPDSKLVAVMRRDAEKAADYARRHQVPKWYADAGQLIADPDVNAIYIATPPDSHEVYALAAIEAGKPVYVEKPMTLNAASAQRIKHAADKAGIPCCVAHYRRAQPRFEHVKSLLQQGTIGEARMVNLQLAWPPPILSEGYWRLDPAISGGGLFHDLSPHQLDLLLYFFGKVEKLSRLQLERAGGDDRVAGTLQFSGGVVCNASWCFTASEQAGKDLFEIFGTKGKISFSVFSTNQISVVANGIEEVIPFNDLPHVQQPMIAAVVRHFLGKGANPCNAGTGVEVMELIDKLYA